MPRLLHHHDRLLARPDRRHLPGLLDRAVPADGRQGALDGRMLVPEEVKTGLKEFASWHESGHLNGGRFVWWYGGGGGMFSLFRREKRERKSGIEDGISLLSLASIA